MKKSLSVITGIALAAALLAGCGSSSDSGNSASSEASSAAVTEAADAQATETTDEAAAAATSAEESTEAASTEGTGSDVLVVYFSATGNTESVAQTIADATGADLFEITPVTPYTEDDLNWSDDSSRVSQEHNDASLQDQVELVSTQVENWDSYDTVFFGYPIWWGNAAWPVNQFVQNNDFTGKTVIPFCTSASSGIGDSGEQLAEMAGTGDWQEGERFSSSPDEAEVTSWAQSMIAE